MASTGIFVHLMGSTSSVFHTFKEDRNHIINVAAIDDNQIFDEEAVGWIPAAMQNS